MPRFLRAAALVVGLPCLSRERPRLRTARIDRRHVQSRHRRRRRVVAGNALPLNRNTLASVSFDASLRHSHWAVDAGWLRIARDLSTVQGGFVSFGFPSGVGSPSRPSVDRRVRRSGAAFSRLHGFDFDRPQRCRRSHAALQLLESGSAGGGVGLTLEVPVYRVVGFRASGSEWYFSGATLEGDRARTLVGVGLSIRVNSLGGIR